jgi:uncharacterized membrane protein
MHNFRIENLLQTIPIVMRIYEALKKSCPELMLIVWKTHDISLKKVISYLEESTLVLPYN